MSTTTTLSYPFDPTGSLASNLIKGEQQQLVAQNFRDQHLIIPAAAPFFADTVQITYKDTSGQISTLHEGVDFYFTHWFISASRACAKRVYGSISFIDTALAGIVSLQYQTVGGVWTLSAQQIATMLANTLDNARTTSWEEISGTPYAFPPEAHSWDVNDLVGMTDVVNALSGIQTVLQQTGGTGLAAHEADHTNPHVVTAAQVGLGNVQNYAPAANSDGVAGTSTTLYMTPATTAAAIQSQVLGPMNSHIANYSNPHKVTAAQIGLGNVQNYGAATPADAAAGVSTSLYMTPATTMAAINNSIGAQLNAHLLDFTNPHEVSAAQVGLGNVRNLSTATNADAVAGTRNDLYMTPATTAAALNASGAMGLITAHEADFTNPHHVTAAQVGAYSSAQVDSMLSGYLTKTGKAADSSLLGGLTVAQLTSQILSGTANNATMLGGMTPAQFQSYVSGGTANDSEMFGGMTPQDWDTYIANATVANANLVYGLTQAALTSAILSGTAANSLELGGQNVSQLTASILAGTAANASQLNGLTQAQLTSAILSGTAANATALGGQSASQLQAATISASNAQLWTSGVVAAQESVPANTNAAANVWTPIGQLKMPGSAQVQTTFPDVQWLVTGGDATSDTQSGAWFLRISVRDTTQPNNVGLQAISLSGLNVTTAVFGYTIDTTNANAPVLTVWMKTPGHTNQISVTSLSENTNQFLSTITQVTTEPTGIVYTTSDTFALASEMSNMLTQLTTAFTTLANAVNGT
jgi:hypothetical protein